MPRALKLSFLIAIITGLSACSSEPDQAGAGAHQGPMAMPVGVITVTPEDLPLINELPGRITAMRIAEVRPQIGGIVLSRNYEQGALVNKGDILFEIDPASYKAAVKAAQASVARAKAVLAEAELRLKRVKTLNETKVSSDAELQNATASKLSAEADLASAEAQLIQAEINLGYTKVKAPITGRTDRAFITEGALVSSDGSDVLTTIRQLDPLYADIQQPVADMLRLRAMVKAGTVTETSPGATKANLIFDDGTQYDQTGSLLFSEAAVDPLSGQVTVRAEFPNPDNILLPGMYVRVAVDQAIQKGVITVPNQAIQRDASGAAFVYVANAQNTVEAKPVKVGRPYGNRRLIETGLAAGDKVIVDGLQKIGPQAPVQPVPWTDPSASSSTSDQN